MLYTGQLNGFYRSTDEGVTWDSLPCKELTGGVQLLRHSSRAAIFANDFGGNIWKTTDEGEHWTSIHNGGYRDAFYSLDVSPAGTLFGANVNGFWLSMDDGTTWTKSLSTSTNNSGQTRSIQFAIGASGSVIVAKDGGSVYQFMQSTDEGVSWNTIDAWSDTLLGYRAVGVAPNNSLVIGGLGSNPKPFAWRASNTASPLSDVSTGVRSTFLTFAFDSLGHAYGGTQGGGLYRTTALLSSVRPKTNLSHSANLESYPNPVSLSAAMTFNSWETGFAEVCILNFLGIEVTHLFSGELQTGEHNFQWNPNPSLPDGLYECIVRQNGEIYRQPMMLIR